jgi:hypothetical protein
MELAAARTRQTPTCHRPSSEVKECTAECIKRSVCWWRDFWRGADAVSCEYECRYQCCAQLPTANTTPISSVGRVCWNKRKLNCALFARVFFVLDDEICNILVKILDLIHLQQQH